MEISFLGTGSGNPILGKNQAAFLVKINNKTILLDCGEGITQTFLKLELDANELDEIFISHFHPDHISGIYMLLQFLYLKKRTKDLTIFLPERIEDFKNTLNLFYSFTERFSYNITWNLMMETESILPIKNDHLHSYKNIVTKNKFANEMIAFSFVLKEKNKKALYSSDTLTLRSLKELENLEAAIIDGLHPNYKEILSFRDKAKVIYLNHGTSHKLQEHLEANPEENFVFAEEGQTIEI